MARTYKCKYKHCLCPDVELTKENGVRPNGSTGYYHPKCWHTKQTILLIIDYYSKHIDHAVIAKQLNAIINNIVFEKNTDADYLMFALQYAHKHKLNIKSPAYLHYLATDKKLLDMYYKKNSNADDTIKVSINKEFDFTSHDIVRGKTRYQFEDILDKRGET